MHDDSPEHVAAKIADFQPEQAMSIQEYSVSNRASSALGLLSLVMGLPPGLLLVAADDNGIWKRRDLQSIRRRDHHSS